MKERLNQKLGICRFSGPWEQKDWYSCSLRMCVMLELVQILIAIVSSIYVTVIK